jgi:hypothetical protein
MSEQLAQTTITLPKDLKRIAQVKAILNDTNLSRVIRELLTKWVEEEDQNDPYDGQRNKR